MELVINFSGGKDSCAMLAYLCNHYSYLHRFSCRVCIYMILRDLKPVREHDPEAIEVIDQLEQKIGFTMFQSGNIKSLAN